MLINVFSIMVILSIIIFIEDMIIEDNILLKACSIISSIATSGMLFFLITQGGLI